MLRQLPIVIAHIYIIVPTKKTLQSLVARAKAQRFWRPKRRGGRNPNLNKVLNNASVVCQRSLRTCSEQEKMGKSKTEKERCATVQLLCNIYLVHLLVHSIISLCCLFGPSPQGFLNPNFILGSPPLATRAA